MTATSFHPQNGRIGDEGLGEAVMEYLNYYRRPYLVVTEHGDRKHRTPLCPEVRGQVYRLICNQEALYVYGERWFETCRHYDLDLERKDTGWTYPRYPGGDRADV